MSKELGKALVVIEDEAQWDSAMEMSESKLVVIDIHSEWCGCCEAVHPSIARILADYEECEKRFVYCTASLGKLGDRIKAALPPDGNVNLEKNGCLPLFGVFRGKTCIAMVVGVDSPTLLQQIVSNMPDKPLKE
ncbi:hypothetical protein B484DRAFT_394409 [Ochromonadaceae sp. CCMP2298]|nr:hypothetical protein B484DRAFT_394409 [Ochromonadaceae sp. CCMP2298]|mmetsp:Transcript_6404/g.14159  ORF Transcript_6404/g.14159 Transcript_6404/m.14159 type:complete len:134 (-) Transcript_6404:884-1285(-)|eukprot:CAMPEP_0173244192 /NCGR_PEP_ID=MMETSP1142-20121109/15956_1 /TAXON_ID=483371 /ORGANISM="non described non described, Strain CCMP2298" /LENGTH=133 /DNA_ID=CAMNT_0014175939 /DNA_START=83 /DNA_END=484 /DNA_ORIENTATION=-